MNRFLTKKKFHSSTSIKSNSANACETCRKLKLKCSEHKPTCDRCKSLGWKCFFTGYDNGSHHNPLPLTEQNLSTLQHEIVSDGRSVPAEDWFPPVGRIPPESTPAHEDELIEFILGPLKAASGTNLSEGEGSEPSGAVSSLGASQSKVTSSSEPLLPTVGDFTHGNVAVGSSHNIFVCPYTSCSRHETWSGFTEYSHLVDHLSYIHLKDPTSKESEQFLTHGAMLDTASGSAEQYPTVEDSEVLVNIGASSGTAASRGRSHSALQNPTIFEAPHEVASEPTCYPGFFRSFSRPASVRSIVSSISSMKSTAGSFINSRLPTSPTEVEAFADNAPRLSPPDEDSISHSSSHVVSEQLNDSQTSKLATAPNQAITISCQFCARYFFKGYSYRLHLRERHLTAVKLRLRGASASPDCKVLMRDFDWLIAPVEQHPSTPKLPWPCPEPTCTRHKNGFSRRWSLQGHYKRVHRKNLSEVSSSLENSSEQNLQGAESSRPFPGIITEHRASVVDVISTEQPKEQPNDSFKVRPSSRPNEKQTCIEVCLYCRRRKMKCDQDWQGCGYCQNRELKCIYGKSSNGVPRFTTQLSDSTYDSLINLTDYEARYSCRKQMLDIPRLLPYNDYQRSHDQQISLQQHIWEPAHLHSRPQSDNTSENSLLDLKITRKFSLQSLEIWKVYKNLGSLLPNQDRIENMAWRVAAMGFREDDFLHSPKRSNIGESKALTSCTHCFTQVTPPWCSDSEDQPLCNACGLFWKIHDVSRSLSLKTDIIKRRNRSSNEPMPIAGLLTQSRKKVSRKKSIAQAHLNKRIEFVQILAELIQNNEIESLMSLKSRTHNWHWRKGAITMRLYEQTSRADTNAKELKTVERYTSYSGKVLNLPQAIHSTVSSWYKQTYRNPARGNDHWLNVNINYYNSCRHIVIIDYLNSAFVSLERFLNLSQHFLRIMLRLDKPLPKALKRVRWRCRCGHYIYDDFAELRPGAVAGLQHLLNTMYQTAQNEAHTQVFFSQLVSSICGYFIPISWNNQKAVSPEDGQLPQFQTEDMSRHLKLEASISKDVKDLNICLEQGRYATVFHPLDLSQVKSDQELFQKMRGSRHSAKGKWSQFFSLRQLTTIKFLQFILHKGNFVDVQARANAPPIPPHDKLDEYKYKYMPIPPEYVPPIGENHMMHLYHHPECASSTDTHLMTLIPKKILSRLAVCPQRGMSIGWGIHFVEGWNADKIVLLVFVLFGMGSLAFALAWSFLEHDIQGAFGVATYITSFLALSICMIQMKIQPAS